jgi:hypothetical protein
VCSFTFLISARSCTVCRRERREYAIFKELIKSVPKLEERIMTGSDEEVTIVADLVSSTFHLYPVAHRVTLLLFSFAKGYPGPERMIQRVLRVP